MINTYEMMKKEYIKGWNTWHSRSVLSYVLLPEGLNIALGLKDYQTGKILKEALIGRVEEGSEEVFPKAHAFDGSYMALDVKWCSGTYNIQVAVENDELVILVTPLIKAKKATLLWVSASMLWNRPGIISKQSDSIVAGLGDKKCNIYVSKETSMDYNLPETAPYLSVALNEPVVISTNQKLNVIEATEIINKKEVAYQAQSKGYGKGEQVYEALRNAMAWDTIYEPSKDRVISTVSRIWNNNWGGYSMYCWDTYFAALLASIESKELAYSNFIEMTNEKTEGGFVPNFAAATGSKSKDRSQPPVASSIAIELYKKFGDLWFIEHVMNDLYQWNRWFFSHRQVEKGLFAWGSNPYESVTDNEWEFIGVNDRFGAALESGLDNSPMYDAIPFNKETHCLELIDVGLTALILRDCEALYEMMVILGDQEKAIQLAQDIKEIKQQFPLLWCEEVGMYLNKRTDTGEFSKRLSPTLFYALFNTEIPEAHKKRMIDEHFYNPDEFWGEWILPSIARNDPAYEEQNYWRGRIWAPLNYLVYEALKKHADCGKPARDLALKSEKLILKEWLSHGHVHENYNANTGEGCDVTVGSDRFYHWGALLSYIVLRENEVK